MSRHRNPLAAARAARPTLAVAAALCLLVPAAHAGLRDLAKSAKDKAAKATGQKQEPSSTQAGPPVVFDDTMLELDGALLAKLIASRKQANAATQGRAAAVARRAAVTGEIDELAGKHGGAIAENQNQRYEVENCITGELSEIKSRRWEADRDRMMANPASAEKLVKLTVALNEAQLKNDTAEVARLTKQMEALVGPTHADTLAAEKKCGPKPPLHPAKVKSDALEQELAQLDAKIRDMDMKAMKLQVEKSGLTEKQIAVAWERIELYLQKSKHSPNPNGFSPSEQEALAGSRPALEAALAG
jgi:hypothetical protein